MGLFGSFFERRRRRESAVQQGNALTSSPPPSEEVKPVGQPLADVGQPISLSLNNAPTDIGGLLGMIGAAMQSGQFQIQQTENQVIDLRGTGLREEIMEAMRQSGVGPEAAGGQIDAGQYGDLQRQILEALQRHGVDVTYGAETPLSPDTDGDGQPG